MRQLLYLIFCLNKLAQVVLKKTSSPNLGKTVFERMEDGGRRMEELVAMTKFAHSRIFSL